MIVYTIGHSNRTLKSFLRILRKYGIKNVFDVRRFPSSRKYPHFSHRALAKSLARQGIDYAWVEALGGFRRFRVDVEDLGLATCFESEGFRAYATYITTVKQAMDAAEKLALDAARAPSAILCRERLPWRCHRKLISDYLLARGLEVVHIIDEESSAPHRLSRCASVQDGKLVYTKVSF